MTLVRLNYSNALRYGVLVDIARAVLAGEPIDVTTGFVNVIWQGDAATAILASFGLCSSPPAVLNVAGPETVSVRRVAERLAELLDVAPPTVTGSEADTALLSEATQQHRLFGYPTVPLGQLIEWTAAWLRQGNRLLEKPTHYQARDGRF
jgi:nucleoside-diphosphate-sugar epimerase